MLTWIAIGAALAAAVVLGPKLAGRFGTGRIQGFLDRRRASSRLVSRGEFIDGSRHLPVALAIGESTLYYENSYMQASLDLEWIGEVEYDDDVVTGQYVGDGKLLRLRCYSQAFEFLIPIGALEQWQAALPAHRGAARASATEGDAQLMSDRELSRADDDGWPTPAVAEGAAL